GADVSAGRDLDAGDGAPAAGRAACLRLAVAGGPGDAAAVGVRAVALVAARRGAGAAARAVRGAAVVAGRVRAVLAAEPAVPGVGRVRAWPRTRACAVHRPVRQRAGGDGEPRHPGPFGPAAEDVWPGVVRLRRHPGGGGDAHRRRGDAGRAGMAGAVRAGLAGRAVAMGVPDRRHLPVAAGGRQAGVGASRGRGNNGGHGRRHIRMIEFYPQIKHAHIGLALLSGGLFALRGMLLLLGARWPNAAPVRYLSYTIDTALLTAAMMLLTILPSALYANGWLAVKVALIVLYVVLGVFALRRGRTRRARAIAYVAALLVFAQVYFIARAHHPLGALYLLD